jgi:hypothetical protein
MLKVRKPSDGNGVIADRDAPLGTDAALDFVGDQEVPDEGALDVAPVGAGHESTGAVADYAELGEHVARVLQAANEAAARIRLDAEADAERIAEESRQEATTTLSEANRDADKVLFEADQRRAEADEAAKATRGAADTYADQQRREAQAQASRLIAEADQDARRRAQAAEERHKALTADVVRTEERLQQLVGGLRDLAARLEEVVHPRGSDADSDAADPPPADDVE